MHARCREAACRAEREDMRVRHVMTRSGRNYRSYYPSKKLSRMVHCESILERKAAQFVMIPSDIDKYRDFQIEQGYDGVIIEPFSAEDAQTWVSLYGIQL